MASDHSTFANAFCCWNFVGNLSFIIHVILPACKNIKRFIQCAGKQYQLQESPRCISVWHFYSAHHHNDDRVSTVEVYATSVAWIRQRAYTYASLLFCIE